VDRAGCFGDSGGIVSTQEQIQESYDVSNDFFRLFLDKRMIYSCGLFIDTDDLEQAQFNKLQWIANAARIVPGMRVLDIGCGWGGNLQFLRETRAAASAVGITLSPAQYDQARRINDPAIAAKLVNYRDFEPDKPFDAITSIGMFEHVATPEEQRSGKSIEIYRDYFRRAWTWTKPGAWFGLQSVIGVRIPRDPKMLRDIAFVTYSIFPGAITPRLEGIMAAVNPYWEVVELQTRREHYARTLQHWHARFMKQEAQIRERWGDQRFADYDRYLGIMIRAFTEGYGSLAQLALRRIDAVRTPA
jgi:cyclopropane-fatty-acyl-phospholipid synthase